MITQCGLIIAPDHVNVLIGQKMPRAFTVRSFDNNHSPKTQGALFEMCRRNSWAWESVFDAAHGRRYMLFVYRNADERKACWDHVTRAGQ